MHANGVLIRRKTYVNSLLGAQRMSNFSIPK
jgi:hypothetical protein